MKKWKTDETTLQRKTHSKGKIPQLTQSIIKGVDKPRRILMKATWIFSLKIFEFLPMSNHIVSVM